MASLDSLLRALVRNGGDPATALELLRGACAAGLIGPADVREMEALLAGQAGGPAPHLLTASARSARDPASARSARDPEGSGARQARFHRGLPSFLRRAGVRAATVGKTIAAPSGSLDASAARGRRLLAHELVHVRQHAAAGGRGIHFDGGPEQDTKERQAKQEERDQPATLSGKYRIKGAGKTMVVLVQDGDRVFGWYYLYSTGNRRQPVRGIIEECRLEGDRFVGRWRERKQEKGHASRARTGDVELLVAAGDRKSLPARYRNDGAGTKWEEITYERRRERDYAHFDTKSARFQKVFIRNTTAGGDKRAQAFAREAFEKHRDTCCVSLIEAGFYRKAETRTVYRMAYTRIAVRNLYHVNRPLALRWRAHLAGVSGSKLEALVARLCSSRFSAASAALQAALDQEGPATTGLSKQIDAALSLMSRAHESLTETAAMDRLGGYANSFARMQPPKISPGQVRTLGDVGGILDYWEMGLKAYLEVYRAFLVASKRSSELTAKTCAKSRDEYSGAVAGIVGLFTSSVKQVRDGFENARGVAVDLANEAQKRIDCMDRGESDAQKLLKKIAGLRKDAAATRAQLARLNPEEAREDEKGTRRALQAGATSIEGIRGRLQALKAPVAKSLKSIGFLQRRTAKYKGEIHRLTAALNRSWLERAWSAAKNATKAFATALKKVDWKEALLVAVEIAGTVLTGGAALIVKVIAWIAGTATRVKNVVTSFKPFKRGIDFLRSLPGGLLARIGTFGGVLATLAGLFFGKNPLGALRGKLGEKGKDRSKGVSVPGKSKLQRVPGGKGLARLIGKLGRGVKRVGRGLRKILSGFFKVGKKVVLTKKPWFRRLAGVGARLLKFWSRLKNAGSFVLNYMKMKIRKGLGRLRKVVGGAFGFVARMVKKGLSGIGKVARILTSPALLAAKLAKGISTWLMGMLVRHPPSRTLGLVLRGIERVAKVNLVAKIDSWTKKIGIGMLSTKLAGLVKKVPFFAKIGRWVGGLAKRIAGLGGGMAGQIKGARASVESQLKSSEGMVQSLTGSSGDKKEKSRSGRSGSRPARKPQKPHIGFGVQQFATAFRKDFEAFGITAVKIDPIIAQAMQDMGKKTVDRARTRGRRSPAGRGIDAFFKALLGRGQWWGFINDLKGRGPQVAADMKQTVVSMLAASRRGARGSLGKLLAAAHSFDAGDLQIQGTGGRGSTLVIGSKEWMKLQALFGGYAGLLYLARVAGSDRKAVKELSQSRHSAAFRRAYSRYCDKLGKDTVFSHKNVPGLKIEADGASIRITSEAPSDALYKGRRLPSPDIDKKGLRRKKLEARLRKMVWTGAWKEIVQDFLLPHGGWEKIGKQMGPAFAPALLDWRTYICMVLDQKFGAKRTGTASGFTSDEDLNLDWDPKENLKPYPDRSLGPAARLTLAEKWMADTFGSKDWSRAFDIAFQLPAMGAHLYTEIKDKKKRMALAGKINEASNAVNYARIALNAHGGVRMPGNPKLRSLFGSDGKVLPALARIGVTPSAAHKATKILGSSVFLASVAKLRKRHGDLLDEWYALQGKTITAPGQTKRRAYKGFSREQIAEELVWHQLALALNNEEAYASPGGVKVTVTLKIREGQLKKEKEKGGGADRRTVRKLEQEITTLREFTLAEALSSVIEDYKNFDHQVHAGNYDEYLYLAILVTGESDREAAARAPGREHDKAGKKRARPTRSTTRKGRGGGRKSRDPRQVEVRPRKLISASEGNLVAAGFRYNLFKYSYRLLDMLNFLKRGKVATEKGPVGFQASPSFEAVVDNWIRRTYSVYKVPRNREIYKNLVTNDVKDAGATSAKLPIAQDEVSTVKTAVAALRSVLGTVVKGIAAAKTQMRGGIATVRLSRTPQGVPSKFGQLLTAHGTKTPDALLKTARRKASGTR